VTTGFRIRIRLIDYWIEYLLPDYKNGKHGIHESHARNDEKADRFSS
jgi:hypothetical protein